MKVFPAPDAALTAGRPKDIRAIGIVVPARNEQHLVAACLQSLQVAMEHPALDGVMTRVLVVLDRCTDETGATCRALGIRTLRMTARGVGQARAAGFSALLTDFLEPSAERAAGGSEVANVAESIGSVWLASTDADTRVAPNWLAEQLRLAREGADAVFGVVDVEDWSEHSARTRERFARVYDGTARGSAGSHRHVHGANMGFSGSAYLHVGGMPDRAVGEDQELSDLMAVQGLRVVRSTAVRVTTSARRSARVHGGFADFLTGLAEPPQPPLRVSGET